MPRRARIHFVSLRSSLVNLPISIYGPLLERGVRPQTLAVHLTLVDSSPNQSHKKVEVYVGWTGMASASSLAQFNASQTTEGGFETIEIDPQYSLGLGLAQGDLVEIGLVHDLTLAESVATEPLSSDDWEIIEIHASHVESTLLSQVRVAKLGQEIDVWVLGRTRVRLRVTSLNPSSKGDALLLTTNTEVSIAPKLSRNKQASSKQVFNGTSATSAANSSAAGAKSESPQLPSQILRVLPLRVAPPVQFPKSSGSESFAFVSPHTFSRLYPSRGDDQSLQFLKTNLKCLTRPTDPSHPTLPSSPSPDLATRLPNSGGSETGLNEINKAGVINDVYTGIMKQLPANHILFLNLPAGVEEWDLLRSSAIQDCQVITFEATEITEETKNALSSPPPSFLAGVDEILGRCISYCVTQYVAHSFTRSVCGVPGLLVTGRAGSGKTTLVREVAKTLQQNPKTFTYVHYVDASLYADKTVSALKALFNYWFDKVAWHRPSVLILDNLDKLLSAETEHADSFRTRHLTSIFLNIFSASARTSSLNARGIVLLATASSTAALHSYISTAHLFKEIVNVHPPNKDARRDILARIVQDRLEIATDMQQSPDSPLNFAALATQTEGYSAVDLQDLVARAVHQVAIRSANEISGPHQLTYADFMAAQADFVPLSIRDIKLEKSDVAWSDIGGLYETRRILQETLEWPTKYGPIFAQSPLRLRSGLLLYGFPGCGKTLLASAVAKECGLNFISVKGPEILNKYIGASEKSVRDLFERASAAKPCVLFFDEFDSIAPKRGHDSTGVTDRVVNQMLTQMDGAEGLEGVYVLAATSRPDLIDSALLRPGRLDKSLFCNMPEYEERKDILKAVANKLAVSPSVDFDNLAAETDGYTGADLQALLYNAHLQVIHASIDADALANTPSSRQEDETPIQHVTIGGPAVTKVTRAEEMAFQKRLRQIQVNSAPAANSFTPGQPPPPRKMDEIRQEHICLALKTTRPSLALEERQRLQRIYQGFTSDRSGDLPVPDAGGIGSHVTLM